jgi:hypothetical protein
MEVATSQGVAYSQWRVRLSKDNYPAMCYLDLASRPAETPRFRTFQVCPKDLRGALQQAEAAEDWARASGWG